MPQVLAHTTKKFRTDDVKATASNAQGQGDIEFEQLFLSEPVIRGLKQAGFLRPSPIQLQAIPLGRFGSDLIAQAKSGTGKTCVFSVIVLENLVLENRCPQALILAPTREIAVQIREVVETLGAFMNGLKCRVFIGGLSTNADKESCKDCHVVVGTPGRIKTLLESGALNSSTIRMVVLDEADQLLSSSFQGQVSSILNKLPERRQTMIFSATYKPHSTKMITQFMRDPQFVLLSADQPSLEGVKQYFYNVSLAGPVRTKSSNASNFTTMPSSHAAAAKPHVIFGLKVDALLDILSKVPFHQCVIFSNNRTRTQELVELLDSRGWPTVSISSDLEQKERMKAMEMVRKFQVRVLVSTDLTARGVDIERITLVINLDLPSEAETYLHRVGRTGRFGTLGVAITLTSPELGEVKQLQHFSAVLRTNILQLTDPSTIPREYFAVESALINDCGESSCREVEQKLSNALEDHGDQTLPSATSKQHVSPVLHTEAQGRHETLQKSTKGSKRKARNSNYNSHVAIEHVEDQEQPCQQQQVGQSSENHQQREPAEEQSVPLLLDFHTPDFSTLQEYAIQSARTFHRRKLI